MNGKERQTFITHLTKEHEEARQAYNAATEELRLITWGKMLGLEAAASCAGMQTLHRDLADLRRRDCGN